MQVDAVLCDHAEIAEGKLFLNGGGINLLYVGPQAPYVINLFFAAVVHVPYTATNAQHTLTLRLLDDDGSAVVPWAPDGAQANGPVVIETEFNVGRPPGLQAGQSQPVPVAFGFPGLPLSRLGGYVFVLEIDGAEERRLTARVLTQPAPTTGFGPTSIPRLG